MQAATKFISRALVCTVHAFNLDYMNIILINHDQNCNICS